MNVFLNTTHRWDLIFIRTVAENAYANETETDDYMCPLLCALDPLFSLWQVSWQSLAFSELQSIFNPVAPLPDEPAIYGPELGQAGWE